MKALVLCLSLLVACDDHSWDLNLDGGRVILVDGKPDATVYPDGQLCHQLDTPSAHQLCENISTTSQAWSCDEGLTLGVGPCDSDVDELGITIYCCDPLPPQMDPHS